MSDTATAPAPRKKAWKGQPTKTASKEQQTALTKAFRSGKPTKKDIGKVRDAYGIEPFVAPESVKAIHSTKRAVVVHGATSATAKHTLCHVSTEGWAGIAVEEEGINCLWCLARIKDA